jgi:thiol-disulfide isomerase/thioredoxin
VSLLDQYGEMVDTYDFAGQGAYVAIDIAATWCGPCTGMADWIAGGDDPYDYGSYWSNVPGNVEDGLVHWLTVLGQDDYGEVPDETVLAAWAEDYPDDKVPVLADTDASEVVDIYLQSGWPTVYLLDENMDIVAMPTSSDHWEALNMIDDL